jgi:kinesin family protein 5
MLKIREDASGGVYLEGVVETVITSPLNLLNCLENAGKKRATGGHAMNARSSRSHLVAILTLTTVRGGVTTVGKLSVCDLAGSEMVRKTEAEGQRLQEAKAINRSLSALGNVINALTLVKEGGGSGQQSHVPYRDSKLTRLLQDSLGGNAKTALIVTASVSSFNVSETLSTLRFGTRAKRLRNKPRVNAERTVGEYKKLLKDSDGKIKEVSANERRGVCVWGAKVLLIAPC